MLISVIITTRNEERNIRDLLDSLVVQEKPIEIIVVDSDSTDKTQQITKHFSEKYDFVKLFVKGGTRGESRNYAVQKSKGSVLAFVDADCIVNPFWIKEIRNSIRETEIVAGKTILIGYDPFEDLGRVELYYKGYDLTFPSCNLAYKKKVFQEIKGFDPWFMTAEDIDLNYRAINLGNSLIYNENAIVYHRARSTFVSFFKQAFWNGYGRKQLTLKHGSLWKNYSFLDMIKNSASFWKITRMSVAVLGFFACKFYGKRKDFLT